MSSEINAPRQNDHDMQALQRQLDEARKVAALNEAEIARLQSLCAHHEQQIEAITQSTTWRLVNPALARLKRYAATLRQQVSFLLIAWRSPIRCQAKTTGDSPQEGSVLENGSLHLTGKCGLVKYELDRVLEAGKYYFKLSYHCNESLIGPTLYFQRGEDLERSTFYTYTNLQKNQLSGFLDIPEGVNGLWLSPSRVTIDIDPGRLWLNQLSPANHWRYNSPWYWMPMVYGKRWMFEYKKREYRDRLENRRKGYHKREYHVWWDHYGYVAEEQLTLQRRASDGFTRQPLISIIMPVYNSPPRYLAKAIDSVIAQSYTHWQLCIADDASTDPECRQVLDAYASQDARISVVYRPQNGHISEATNSAIALANGDYIALLDHDDELAPQALYRVVETINRYPCARMLYSDEDIIDADDQHLRGHFKPAWNPDLLRSINYICHLLVIEAALVNDIGGMRASYEGAQDYDLVLRATAELKPEEIQHIPYILYHWRAIEGSTALDAGEKNYAKDAGLLALNDILQRQGESAKAQPSEVDTAYRVVYALPTPAPRVSIIIPTYNGRNILENTITSIIEKTEYPNYDILVIDNRSNDEATLRYLKDISQLERVRVIRDEQDFNYSAINNQAARQVEGELLLFMNNDVEVINPDWLTEMAGHALRDGIGAVGAKLFFSNDHLQHAGVILGIGPEGIAGHVYRGDHKYATGMLSRLRLTQNYSAVTAACLAVKRDRFEEVGGFNEVDLKVAFNDIDLCLKLRKAGYRNVWTPYAQLYHFESISRGYEVSEEKKERLSREARYMRRVWGEGLLDDPAYNPNLTLDTENFAIAFPPRVDRPTDTSSHS